MSTDITVLSNVKSALTDDALAAIVDFDSAAKVFNDTGVVAEAISDYGTGFALLTDKNRLVGTPFIIVEWRFNDGDYENDNGEKTQFASAAVVTKNGEKWVLNDGGSGICAQLASITKRRQEKGHATPQNGLLVPAGLTRSDYTYTDEKGKNTPATTFYLSESPEPARA